jgi:hypothetical protein
MSYDLTFWKPAPSFAGLPQGAYEQLSEELSVDGLETLPIDAFKERICQTFPGCTVNKRSIDWSDETTSFQVTWSPQHVRVDCYNLPGDAMNKFIDIALEFDCPLYDPQVGQRYGA